MLTRAPRPGLARPLCSVFAALLAACTERDPPADETGGETDTGAPTTSTSGTATTTDEPGTTTANPTTSDTSDTSDTVTSASASASDSLATTDAPMCVYEDHEIVLTPEAYDAWLHGMGEVGSSGTTDAPDTTGDASTGTSTGTGTSTATSTGDTDTAGTTGALEWSTELCIQICDALTTAEEWNILTCEQTGVDEDGNVSILCVEIVEQCDGRGHACITSRGALRQADPVVSYLARAAHDEAASVHAFAALAQELAALGAPAQLLARILSAARDELRHARAVSRLVADRGGRCRPPQRRPLAPRDARELALENAVEGCVRETWAALLAAHQAEHAADPELRAVMRGIAADEARHAELAWAIDAWLHTQLGPDAHAEILLLVVAAYRHSPTTHAADTPAPAVAAAPIHPAEPAQIDPPTPPTLATPTPITPSIPPPLAEPATPDAPATATPTRDPDFNYRSARRYIDEQSSYLRETCMQKGPRPREHLRVEISVQPGGVARIAVPGASAEVRGCVRRVLAFPFDPSPRGAELIYTLTSTRSRLTPRAETPT